MQTHHPCRHFLAHFQPSSPILSNFEQFDAVFFARAGFVSSNFKHFCRASLGHVEQFWTISGNTIWHCQPWRAFKLSQVRLLWNILLWLKKVADVNPTDLDPKKVSVNKMNDLIAKLYPQQCFADVCRVFAGDSFCGILETWMEAIVLKIMRHFFAIMAAA